MTVTNSFNWTGGTFTDPGGAAGALITNGTTTADTGGVGLKTLTNLPWQNNGSVDWDGGNFSLTSASTEIINDGTFNANGADIVSNTGMFTNNNTFNKTAAGVTAFSTTDFLNNGTVNVNLGTLRFNVGADTTSTPNAVWNLAAGATLDLNRGTHTYTNTAPITGAGTLMSSGVGVEVNFDALNTSLPAGLGFNAFNIIGGLGSLTLNNNLTFNGGTISINNGLTTAGTTEIDATTTVDVGTTWTNTGSVNLNGTAGLDVDGVFENNNIFNALGTGGLPSSVGRFNNNPGASFNKPDANNVTIFSEFNNDGTVDIDQGTLAFQGDSNTTGVFDLAGAATLQFTGLGGGVANFDTPTPFIAAAGAQLAIVGANPAVNFNSPGTVLPANLSVQNDVFLGGSGDLQIDGPFTLNGTVSISGSLTTTNTVDVDATSTISGVWNNQGTLDWNGGTINLDGGIFNNDGVFNILTTTTVNGTGIFNHNNAAVINKSTAGDTRYFVTTFNANSGSTINISAGSLTIDNFVNNFGTVTLTNNTTLNTAPTFVNRTGGLVQGVGTVDATTFINQGNVGPGNSPDILVINGDLDLDPTSVLDFEIGGTTPGPTGHDQIVVTGNVTLDGTINATLFGGFTPSDGNIFDIILGTIVGGSFATENLPVNFTLADLGDRVRLTFNSGAGCGGTICFDNSDLDFLWTKMNNWDLDRLPVPADIVVVDLGGGNTVVLDSGVQSISSLTSIENLDITGGTLTIANPSAFNGNVLIDGGTINGTGDINLNGNLTWRAGGLGGAGQVLNTNATTTLETPATKTILGNWTNSGGIDLDAGVLSVTGSVINQGFFNANSTTGGTITGAGNFLNDTTGTFNKATAGTTQVTAGTFDNDGMVSVTGGTLERTGGGNYTGGTFTADAGTFVEFGGGNYSFDAASQLVGPGRFRFNDGTHNVNAAFSTTPTVDLGDPLAIVALTNDLTGVILLVSQGTLNASTALDQLTFSGGVLNVTGGVDVNNMTWSGGNISGTGTLRNQGTIDYTGGTTTAALSNSGTLNVQSGTLALSVGATHGSDFDVSGGATLQLAGGTHDLTGNSTFTGAGTVDVAAAGTMKVSGNTTMSADLTCSGTVNGGGTLTFNGGTSNTIGGTYNVTGTTVVDTSTVNFTSAATFDTLDVNPGAAVTLSPAGTTVSSLDISGGTLTNNGGLATNGSSVLSGGTVQGTGSWNNNGSASLSGSTALTLTGNVNNSGALVKTGAGTSTFTNAAFANTGGVNVSAGTLSFAGGFQQDTGGSTSMSGGNISVAGTMQIDGGSVGGVGSITAPNVQLDGGSFAPGASPGTTTINGNFTQNGGTLGIELGGNTQGVNFDLLNVIGDVTINGGTVGVSLVNQFVGTTSDKFRVIEFTGVLGGTGFAGISEPPTHQISSQFLPGAFELSFLSILLAFLPTDGSLDPLNEILPLLELQDKFVDDAAIDDILEQLAGVGPTVKCQ